MVKDGKKRSISNTAEWMDGKGENLNKPERAIRCVLDGGFRQFLLNGNGRTYGRTDTPSYGDARTHQTSPGAP